MRKTLGEGELGWQEKARRNSQNCSARILRGIVETRREQKRNRKFYIGRREGKRSQSPCAPRRWSWGEGHDILASVLVPCVPPPGIGVLLGGPSNLLPIQQPATTPSRSLPPIRALMAFALRARR